MKYEVICDFDGTISVADTTDALLDRFADPAWHAVEEAWQRGEFGSAICMQRQIELLKVERDSLDEWLAAVAIDTTFKDFVAYCQRRQVPISIASDGIDYVIKTVLHANELGFLKVTANHLDFAGDDSYRLTPNRSAGVSCSRDAGVCKCSLVNRQHGLVVYIGDGRSDFCVSERVDLVLAKSGSALAAYCEKHKITHVPFHDFAEAIAILQAMESTINSPTFAGFAQII